MTASRRSAADRGRSAPRLYLVAPPLDAPALAGQLAAALDAADVAAVLVRAPAAGKAVLIEAGCAVASTVRGRGVALLSEDRPTDVEPAGADGAHVAGFAALEGALPLLKPRYIVGCAGAGGRPPARSA